MLEKPVPFPCHELFEIVEDDGVGKEGVLKVDDVLRSKEDEQTFIYLTSIIRKDVHNERIVHRAQFIGKGLYDDVEDLVARDWTPDREHLLYRNVS